MKKLLFFLFLIASGIINAQNFSGQWKGSFTDKSSSAGWSSNTCDYVLDLVTKGNQISGFSYTYFNDGSKRYYTICKLTGNIDVNQRKVEIREVDRVKTNVPKDISNCFQLHRLVYTNANGEETLKGNWVPSPKQPGDCGSGSTMLARRKLIASTKLFNAGSTRSIPVLARHKTITKDCKSTPLIAKATVKAKKNDVPLLAEARVASTEVHQNSEVSEAGDFIPPPAEFQKRNLNVLKTIEVENDLIRVDLYDNGEIDGDSISLFYNGKVILTDKKLSDKPITVRLSIDTENDVNELVMFAKNLGTIPPNTALMIVTDGSKRYEVRIISDLQKSGVIRFVKKE